MTPYLTSTASESSSITPTVKLDAEDSGNTNKDSTFETLAMNFGPVLGGTSLLLVCAFYILHKRRKNRSVTKALSTTLEQYLKQQGCQLEDKTSTASEEERKLAKHAFRHEILPDSPGIDEEGGRLGLRLSSLTVSGSRANPLRTAAVTKTADPVMQNIQIIESRSMKDSKGFSTVKVVSIKAPDISQVSKTTETTQIQMARIEDIDTSGMKWINRSVLKLRKWKAFILAEVPHMVEVEIMHEASTSSSTNSLRRDAFIQRLTFANKLGGDRSVIDSEARAHSLSKREEVSQRQRKKKEFHAAPRRMGRASFSKPRSHTASL